MFTRIKPSTDTTVGCIVAFAITILINLPLWHGLLFTNELQRPDVVIESSDEEFYISRIREVADGHLWAGHPYVYELRDQRYPIGNLWELKLGLIMRWMNIDIKTLTAIADALFPFLLVLILWKAVRPVLPDYRWRLLLIGILFLGFEMHWWKRPISPQETTILPLLWLWAALSPKRASLTLTAIRGALVGIMTLSYPFHWTYCLAAEALLTGLHLWKDVDWNIRLRRFGAAALPFALFALPWIILQLSIHNDPIYSQTLERLGMLSRRFPSGIPLQGMIVIVGIATYIARRKAKDTATGDTLFVLLFASLAVLNQMIITGTEAEFSNHYRQIIILPLWISLLWSIRQFILGWRRLLMIIPAIGLCIVTVRTAESIQVHWHTYGTYAERTDARETTNALMDFLNTLPGEQVILTDDETGRNATMYTHHYPFFVFHTHMYLMDNDEIWRRARTQQTLFPEYQYPPRAIIGSSYLNKALHEKTLCRLRSFIGQTDESCDVPLERYLPERWNAFLTEQPDEAEMLQTLRDAYVSYVLMKDIPAWLEEHVTSVGTVEGYTLASFGRQKP